jgi:dTDP-glucose 4,6-dehydratase
MRTVLVTGGAGFIGSNFVHYLLERRPDYRVVVLDKLTYAGNLDNLKDVQDNPQLDFREGDICDRALVDELARGCWGIVNFAAESHVDRSLLDPGDFIQTDVFGVYVLLQAVRQHGVERFLQVSTDEVYGSVATGSSIESDRLAPRNPYSASKAGGELQVRAFTESYGLPAVITRASNTIGPYQYPEKATPLFITNAIDDLPLPIYGRGTAVRDYLYVRDHCSAIDLVLHEGVPGEAYNVGGGNEVNTVQLATAILDLLGKPHSLMRFVEDRPGHDQRYSLDSARAERLGWQREHDFASAIERTVRWYADNAWWWRRLKSGEYLRYYQEQYGKRLASSTAVT